MLELQGHHHSHHRDFSQYGGGRGALRGGGPVGRTAVGGQPAGRPAGLKASLVLHAAKDALAWILPQFSSQAKRPL